MLVELWFALIIGGPTLGRSSAKLVQLYVAQSVLVQLWFALVRLWFNSKCGMPRFGSTWFVLILAGSTLARSSAVLVQLEMRDAQFWFNSGSLDCGFGPNRHAACPGLVQLGSFWSFWGLASGSL